MKENKMGYMNMDKLILSMSTPMIISMLVQSLYNIVDSMFVSMISEDALTAVSLCFPIQTLMIALGVGINIGVNSIIAKSLGEKNFEKASKTANIAIFISLCTSLIFTLFGLFFAKDFFEGQNLSEQIKTYGIQYLSLVTIFSQSLLLQICFEKLLSSTGNTMHTMITQLSGAIVNIILDPIFIFKLNMGVKGAAIATVIGLGVGTIIGFYLCQTKNKQIRLSLKSILSPKLQIIKEILNIGIPSALMRSIASFTLMGFNFILSKFSTTAVAFFGIFFKLDSFMILPIIGLANGMVPVIAYNYGAKNKTRIHDAMKTTLKFGSIMTLIGIIIIEVFPEKIIGIFNPSPLMLSIGVPALRIIALCYLFAYITITLSSVFQALGNAYFSMIVSFVRQIVVLLPLAYLFSYTKNLNLVWSSFVISDFVCLILAITLTKMLFKRINLY